MKTRRYRSAYKEGKKDGYMQGYLQGLHDGNPFTKIADAAANMAKVISDKMSDPAFIEVLKKANAIKNHDREFFEGRCPYTDKPCDSWTCQTCEVEQREREWLENDDTENYNQ